MAVDGAFVVNRRGVVDSAGIYLNAPIGPGRLSPGLGARHAAALAITTVTDATAVVISASSGRPYRCMTAARRCSNWSAPIRDREHDIVIGLFVNQDEFVEHDPHLIRFVSRQESRSDLIGEKRHRVRDQLRTKTTADIGFHNNSGQPHGLL